MSTLVVPGLDVKPRFLRAYTTSAASTAQGEGGAVTALIWKA